MERLRLSSFAPQAGRRCRQADEGQFSLTDLKKPLAGCGRNVPAGSSDATLKHKKIPLPLFRICSIPILTFDNEPP
ncbi:hypothetical protein EFR00_08805 [Rhizobium sophoriradicis]|nr:hypothetical protein EFR00_08805 [Rhizobium sophoriradicis]